MGQYDTPIPSIISPEGTRCVPLYIPDDPDYITMVLEHIRKLTNQRNYERDEFNSALLVADELTQRTFVPFLDDLINGVPCGNTALGSNCFQLTAASKGVQFFGNSPFIEPSSYDPNVSALGVWVSWQIALAQTPDWLQSVLDFFGLDTLLSSIGYGIGDVFVNPTPSNAYEDDLQALIDFVEDTLSGDYPRVKIDLIGTGSVRLNLLSIPSGGTAVIVKDDVFTVGNILQAILDGNISSLNGVQIVELQRDLIQLPPETVADVSVTVSLDGDENTPHNIKVYYLPRFDDQFTSPLGIGGGFRSVEICDTLTVIDGDGNDITFNTFKGQETIKDEVFTMVTSQELCEAVECGMERIAQRIVSGQAGNISGAVTINADGTTTVTSSDGGGIVPTTASAQRVRMGRVEYVESKLSAYIQDWEDYYIQYGGGLNSIESSLKAKYKLDETNLTAQVTTYANYIGGGGSHPPETLAGLDRVMYCNGIDKTVINGWILDDGLADNLLRIDLVSLLLDEQLTLWESQATGISDDFQNALCYRDPDIIMKLNEATRDQRSGDGGSIWNVGETDNVRTNRTYQASFSGTFVRNSDGLIYDGMYTDDGNGNRVYKPMIFQNTNGSGTRLPTSQPFYSPNGYDVVYQTSGVERVKISDVPTDANWTGGLTVVLKDFGSTV